MPPILSEYEKLINYEFEDTFKYANTLEDSRAYQIDFNGLKDMVENSSFNTISEWQLPWLFDIGIHHYEYSIYAKLHLKDEIFSKKHLSLAISYASVSLKSSAQSCGCYEEKNPFITMNKSVFMMSIILLISKQEEFETIGKYLIDSLNGKGCIIKRGYPKATISWFVLKLFSLYSKEEITLNPLLQPKDVYGYNEILDDWDTENSFKVELYLQKLCEYHLVQAQKDDDIYLETKDDPDDLTYRELFLISSYFLPYEVMVWLKLRERAGLKNPKTFTHPLMNTPIAKMFLNVKEPLPKPTELPYAKELLEKLKEKCPDVEVPEWLEENTEKVNEAKSNDIIPDDFLK